MKQKIYIAALLAGMLALAGCGGGSSSDDSGDNGENGTQTLTAEQINAMNVASRKAACTGDGLTYDESSMLCKVDTSATDAKAADAIAEALKGYNLPSHADDDNALADYDGAKKMDFMKKGSISMEGEAFNKLATADLPGNSAYVPGTNKLTIAAAAGHTAKSDSFGTGQLVTFAANKPNTDGDQIWEGRGSYEGVDGMFSCTFPDGGACTARKLTAGITFSAGWSFKPDDPTAKVTVDDLVTFGFWSDNDPGDSDYALGLFTTRALLDATPGAAKSPHGYTGTGTATFKGTAVGHFSVGEGGDATQGDFEAPAELTATFTNANAAQGTLKGTITADTWSVELMEARLASGYNVNAVSGSLKQADGTASNVDASDGAPTQTVWTLNGDKGDPGGSWQAALYHSIGADAGAVTVANDFPDYTAGEFTAEHGLTGFMIGAFAAELDE